MENLVASYSKAFRAKEQTTLDDFKSPNFEPKKEVKKPLVYEMFETHGIHYRGKFLKASRIALVVILLLELLLVSGIITTQIPKSQLVVAPAYFTDVQILPKDQLPANIEFTFSEDMESISVNKSYAIPIVRVQTSNISFLAPISHRLVSLNSSNYIVSETSDYLSFNLKKCYIEITLSGSSFGNISYHQENNACFDYIGFSRDAEILYELAQFGYNQTIIFSDSSAQGLDQTTQQKLFFSDGENSSNVLITINKVRPLTDTTSIYSDNQAFTNQTTFLIQQTKVVTTIANDSTIPQIPFRVVISDG
jgi:hypothetical protein